MALNDTAIRALKPKETPFKVADSGGLYLLINPTGSRLWRLKYRVGKKEKVLSLGAYPIVTLAAARSKREEAKSLLARGIDPSEAKQEAKREIEAVDSNRFRVVAGEYLEKIRREGRAPATMKKREWLMGLAIDEFGDRPVREITAPIILEALRKFEKRDVLETARRLRSTIGAVFRYAIATTRADVDPTQALAGALTSPSVTHRAAILDPTEFGRLLRAIDSYGGEVTTKSALQLMAMLAPRPGELRMASWSEFDLDNAVWIIPAEHAKMRREHRIPLPPQAVAVLRHLHRLTGRGRLVFPSTQKVTNPISENTLNLALRRMGFAADEMTSHGFRATVSTLLNECGKWHADAIERHLAHVEKNGVRRAYARGEHWDERVRMLAWWADYLDELRLGKAALL